MKAFVTKYALTAGIKEIDGEVSPDYPEMLTRRSGQYLEHYHGEEREWHRTREAAVERAEEMRKAKIASLEKQIARLKALRFA